MMKTLAIAATSGLIALTMASPAIATPTKNPGGKASNNGTLKIHERGTEARFIDNDPKVCDFNFEAFKLDGGLQDGYVTIYAKKGAEKNDKTWTTVVKTLPLTQIADKNGYAETAYVEGLENGHYKAELFDKAGNILGEKAKSKTFKVKCAPGETTVPPAPTTTPTPTESSSTAPEPSGSTSTAPEPTGSTSTAPEPTNSTPSTPAETTPGTGTPSTGTPGTDVPGTPEETTPAPSQSTSAAPVPSASQTPPGEGPRVETDSVAGRSLAYTVSGAVLVAVLAAGGVAVRRRYQA